MLIPVNVTASVVVLNEETAFEEVTVLIFALEPIAARVVTVSVAALPERAMATPVAPDKVAANCSMVSLLVAVTITPRTEVVSGTTLRFERRPGSLTSELLIFGLALPSGSIFWVPVPAPVKSTAFPARASSADNASLMTLVNPSTGIA